MLAKYGGEKNHCTLAGLDHRRAANFGHILRVTGHVSSRLMKQVSFEVSWQTSKG
jgi:hypothetical protein